MGVETWNKPLTEIDNTYGYNDMLLMPGGGSMPVTVRDRLTEADTAGASNPSGSISDLDAQRIALPGDQLYRLPNGGLLLRRSVFNDPCQPGSSRPNNSLLLSEPMSRALAFFGASYQGSDPSGDLWCRRSVPGTAGNIETPWNVSSMGDLRSIEEVLDRIRSARAGHLPSDIQPAQEALAKELAAAVPAAELKTLASDISTRRERLESAGELFMRHPVLHTLGIAILFGLGTDVYHIARYALFGGESPFKSGGRGLFTRLYQGLRKLFGKDPKDPPAGGGGGGSKDLPQILVKDIPADAKLAGGFVVQNGKVIGVASAKREITEDGVISGETDPGVGNDTVLTPLPDFVHDWDEEPTREWVALPGVVTEDKGALIYAPQYQAIVGGHFVALLPESGLQSLAGPNANYTVAEFSARVATLRNPATANSAAAYQALIGGNATPNYGTLGYAQSTRTAVMGSTGFAPGFRPTVAPLTFGGGTAPAFRMPSIAVEPVPVPVR